MGWHKEASLVAPPPYYLLRRRFSQWDPLSVDFSGLYRNHKRDEASLGVHSALTAAQFTQTRRQHTERFWSLLDPVRSCRSAGGRPLPGLNPRLCGTFDFSEESLVLNLFWDIQMQIRVVSSEKTPSLA